MSIIYGGSFFERLPPVAATRVSPRTIRGLNTTEKTVMLDSTVAIAIPLPIGAPEEFVELDVFV